MHAWSPQDLPYVRRLIGKIHGPCHIIVLLAKIYLFMYLFLVVLEFEFESLILAMQAFYHLSHAPSPFLL
jgi:hypothetical protein